MQWHLPNLITEEALDPGITQVYTELMTSAGEADSYVWSSRPVSADGPMTLWLVPSDAAGLRMAGTFDGLGLRGNASNPVTADGVVVTADARLGADGEGLDIALTTGLPTFLVGNAAFSIGLMEAMLGEAAAHLTGTRLERLDQTMAQQPISRAEFARLRTRADEASDVADGVMRLCGGSAFRKELGVERCFRDSLAARVMAPTTDALRDFVGRASLGLPLFDGAGT